MTVEKQQKRARAEATYAFGKTDLSYVFRYGASVHRIVADYFEITPARKFTSRRDWSQFQYAIAMAAVGLAAMAAQTILSGATPLSALWLMPCTAYFALFVLRPDHFRIFQAAGDPFWILEGRHSQDIIAEIELRRRNRLAEIYGPLSLANEPRLEIGKIEWLVEEFVMTREEADNQIASIHAHATEKTAAAKTTSEMPKFATQEALAI